MKNFVLCFFLILGFTACQDETIDFDSMPDCLKEQIEAPNSPIIKVGFPKEDLGFSEDVYWVFYEDSFFGNQLNADCEQAACYGWCGLTTRQEVEQIYDRSWETLWEK